ncbi:MAG: biosynthetic peptidoglycan transglycosylase [Polyangiaceae bacterium]
MRRAYKIAGVAGVLALVGATIVFGPLVRAKARAAAEERGMEVAIGSVRPGPGRIWLRGISVTLPQVPSVSLELDAVEVRVGPLLDVKSIRVHGGRVQVKGTLQTVRQELDDYRSKRRAATGGAASRRELSVDGIDLTWEDIEEGAEPQHAWGLRYSRDSEGESFDADLVRASYAGVALALSRGSLRLDSERRLSRVGSEGATLELDTARVQPLRRAIATEQEEPAKQPQDGPPAAPTQKKPSAVKEPKPPSLLERRFPLDAGRPGRIVELVQSLARGLELALPAKGEVDLNGVKLRLRHRGERLALGPVRVSVTHDGKLASLNVVPSAEAKQPLRVALKLPLSPGEVELSVAGGPVPLATLGMERGDLGIQNLDEATLELDATLRIAKDGSKLHGFGHGKVAHLNLEQKWLAPKPVRQLEVGFRGRGSMAVDGSRVDVEEGELSLGKVRTEAKGFVRRSAGKNGERLQLVLEGGVPLASCQTMLDSLPEGLAPLLRDMQASGTFTMSGRLELDTDKPADVVTRWDVGNQCRITATPADVSPQRFKSTWTREVRGGDGRLVQIQSGPGTASWTPRSAISKHMDTAVLICEDGHFFGHNGFDEEAIRNSIRENLKAGKFLRGASTISMQLAKNLYLPRDKTLSRKLQEAVLTLLLEQQLTKDEILELYLNVIEYGPGIYGIGPAAAYYFNAAPHQLSLGQSLYLASVLPNPKRHYFGADGRVTPGWMGYLRKLMRIGYKIRRVSEAELGDALLEEVTFKVPYSPRLPSDEEEVPADPFETTPAPAP